MATTVTCQGGLDKMIRQAIASKAHVNVGIKSKCKDVAEYATYLEYGWVQRVTKKQEHFFEKALNGTKSKIHPKAGGSLVLPPRPTFHATARAEGDKWRNILTNAIKKYGVKNIQAALSIVGQEAVSDLQATIRNNGTKEEPFPDRSPLTLAMLSKRGKTKQTDGTGGASRKKALYRNGDFLNSLGYEIKVGK